jgi:hypothetical protein
MTQYVQEKVIKMENPVTAWALFSLIVGLVFVYAYFVNGTIQNIVEAKDMRVKISALTSSIGNLEASYLEKKGEITLEYAHSKGFVESSSSALYIAKKSEASLSFNR